MSLQITPLNDAHLKECAALFVSVFNAEPYNDLWTQETAYKRLHEMVHSPGFLGFVCHDAGRMVGLVVGCARQWYSGRVYELQEMCVALDAQGKGAGSQLMRVLEVELARQGVTLSYLMTRQGGPGEVFYSRKGYRVNVNTVVMLRQFSI
ncbi:MAG: GNAT family N-acetyltransferase [Anaerolineae bacterium]|nr:GNAT family N-acetyltransferase [Anaerolineae bacterium]